MRRQKPKKWTFIACTGEVLADLEFYRTEIKKLFPGAKIVKNTVYLP